MKANCTTCPLLQNEHDYDEATCGLGYGVRNGSHAGEHFSDDCHLLSIETSDGQIKPKEREMDDLIRSKLQALDNDTSIPNCLMAEVEKEVEKKRMRNEEETEEKRLKKIGNVVYHPNKNRGWAG